MKKIYAIALLLFLTACLRTDTLPPAINSSDLTLELQNQNEFLMSETRSQEKRVADIWWRLSVSNLELCPKDHIKQVYGFDMAQRERYARGKTFKKTLDGRQLKIRSDNVIKAYDTTYGSSRDWLTVGYVYEGSAAEKAGLKAKDRIVSVDYRAYENRLQDRKDFYEYIADMGEVGNDIVLEIRRGAGDTIQKITISPEAACYYPIFVTHDDGLSAYTDGKALYINMEMLDFLRTDEEVANVIAHEMAHAMAYHVDRTQVRVAIGSILDLAATLGGYNTQGQFAELGGLIYSQAQETEADYMGLYIMTRAGYEIEDTPDIWRRMAIKNPASNRRSFLATHPTPAERFIVMEETIAEIQRKQKYDLPLYPELR